MAGTEHDAARMRALVREALGREVVACEPIEAGLGARRFLRVRLHGSQEPRTLVARLEAEEDPALRPPGIPPEPALEPIRACLERRGLPVPRCYATAPELTLLEDVGATSLESAAASLPEAEVQALYREACGLVPRLQATPTTREVPNFGRHLDEALFRYKAEQVVEWVLPLAAGAASPGAPEAVREAFAWVAEVARAAPQRLAHRDFKAANLHLRPHPRGGARLALIDLQGAFLAPPEYDLVCLLRDSHVELAEPFVQEVLAETRPLLPDAPAPETFARRFALLTLTRNGKDLARYRYAALVRNDTRYLRLVPRAIRTLQAAAREVAELDPRIGRLAEIFASLSEPPCAE